MACRGRALDAPRRPALLQPCPAIAIASSKSIASRTNAGRPPAASRARRVRRAGSALSPLPTSRATVRPSRALSRGDCRPDPRPPIPRGARLPAAGRSRRLTLSRRGGRSSSGRRPPSRAGGGRVPRRSGRGRGNAPRAEEAIRRRGGLPGELRACAGGRLPAIPFEGALDARARQTSRCPARAPAVRAHPRCDDPVHGQAARPHRTRKVWSRPTALRLLTNTAGSRATEGGKTRRRRPVSHLGGGGRGRARPWAPWCRRAILSTKGAKKGSSSKSVTAPTRGTEGDSLGTRDDRRGRAPPSPSPSARTSAAAAGRRAPKRRKEPAR